AAAAAHQLGLKWPEIKEGIESFQGVKRRFEVHIKNKDLVYIDDYAHHPKEIEALIQSVKELYPQKKITTIFQPHLFSRTRDFSNEFADALSLSDNLLLLDIYPAREKPIQGITSEWLLAKTECASATVVSKEDLNQKVLELKPQVVLTVGAGDIDQCVEPLKSALLKE
ncbi:MAG: UDP-N-acetylmuramate--L-alanine ligase, partial [Schleiferiaceae bacterium]|nr:UDP-N-acetylmuramate--L-alanine ligase [Schleiferiaceae bacterium]